MSAWTDLSLKPSLDLAFGHEGPTNNTAEATLNTEGTQGVNRQDVLFRIPLRNEGRASESTPHNSGCAAAILQAEKKTEPTPAREVHSLHPRPSHPSWHYPLPASDQAEAKRRRRLCRNCQNEDAEAPGAQRDAPIHLSKIL